jgi:hypothetical protein
MSAPVLAFTNTKNDAQAAEAARPTRLMKKIAKLERVHPKGAAVIEKCVDDLLK